MQRAGGRAWSVWILFVEFLLIAVLVPSTWTENAIRTENGWVKSRMGHDSAEWIERKSTVWYTALVVDSGFLDAAYRHMLPSEEEKRRSKGLERLGEQVVFPYIEARLKVFFYTMYQLFARLALLVTWLPFLMIVAVPAIIDGMLLWRIRRLTFAYNSPLVHGYATVTVGYGFLILLIALFAPIALPPEFFPFVLSTMALASAVMAAHAPKRI